MAYQSMDRPRYVVPALGTVYSAIEVYSWPLVRAATGFFFLPHGMQKLFGFWGGDITRTAEGFAKQGLNPSLFWAYYIGCLEFFGGILLISACSRVRWRHCSPASCLSRHFMSIWVSAGSGRTGGW